MFWAIEQFLNRDKRTVEEYIRSLEEQARASGVIQIGNTRFAVTVIPSPSASAEAGDSMATPPKTPGSQA